MGEKYGTMSATVFQTAIWDTRNHTSREHSNEVANKFLKSIRAACNDLPHTNEASQQARRVYFSLLISFGLPCIFLTVNPDDLRNFRIVVYSLTGSAPAVTADSINAADLRDDQILADFNMRREARVNHPGLCAEEYDRIVHLVIKHLFNWDMENQESNGMGLFARIEAFALATEEQG
jgi:hypothetical protein